MALKSRIYKLGVYFIFFILILIIFFLFQTTFIDFFDEKENYYTDKINSQIKIGRNKYGFTKVKCNSIEDYYFSTGFMQANDRFIQLELLRKIGKGELSLFLKSDLSIYDKILKDFDLIEKAKNIKNNNSEINYFLNKYVEGINLFIEKNKNHLPLEFGLINYDIEKFNIDDIYLINEVYNLMYDNNLKINLFALISSIQLGINKTEKLFDLLNIKINKNMLNNISSRKYTYGELNYLNKIYELIELLNYGLPISFDSPYYIKSSNQKLFAFNHYSKTFLNFSPYYQESYLNEDTISALYYIGLPFPKFQRKNNIVYSEIRNNFSSYYLKLYDISENRLKYKILNDTNFYRFNISIDTIRLNNKSKLNYSYITDNNETVINYDDNNFSLGLSLNSNYNNNNFKYLHTLLFKDSIINYSGNNFSYIYFNNNIKYQINEGEYYNIIDTINIFNSNTYTAYSLTELDNYYINNNINSNYNNRLIDLLSDDHKFTLTDLRLINNDNKNILAELYLDTLLNFLNANGNKTQKIILNKLKNWDKIDEINKTESILFNLLCDEFIKNYLNENYSQNIYKYVFQTPYLKNILLNNLFKNMNESEIIKHLKKTFDSFSKVNLDKLQKNYKLKHILTYYNNKELISLELENYKGNENNIKFFHNFEKNLITNNASMIFNLNENKNYLILNSGQSARLESTWYKNLFKIWTTGGLVESILEFKDEEQIIEINEN